MQKKRQRHCGILSIRRILLRILLQGQVRKQRMVHRRMTCLLRRQWKKLHIWRSLLQQMRLEKLPRN